MIHLVKAEKLTGQAFAPFGTVIETTDADRAIAINSGTCLKFAELAMPDCTTDGGKPALHIFRATPLLLPITIKMFERHALGSQTFVPLSARPYLVVVAPPGDFRIEHARVFRAEGNQGVQYHRGTWHHFCLALEAESEFLVIDRYSSRPDCDEITLPKRHWFAVDH